MTEFKVNDRVELINRPIEEQKIGDIGTVKEIEYWNEGDTEPYGYTVIYDRIPDEEFCEQVDNIRLAEPQKETEVTEYNKGDKVRLVRRRNAPGAHLTWDADKIGKILTISGDLDVNEDGVFGNWKAYGIKEYKIWVRSDDIELVSRAEEPVKLAEETFNHHIEDIKQILEPIPFGTIHFGPDSKIKIEPEFNDYEDPYVRLKIKKSTWDAEELAGLVDYLENVIHVLEGELPGESGECLAFQIEDLLDSNERLVSANEAKRDRLAKIRELTEE